jgi:hypothetical protein
MNFKKTISQWQRNSLFLTTFIFLVMPASTGYQLKGYSFGGGGGTGSSNGYKVEGAAGQVAGDQTGTTYKSKSGLMFVQQTNTPDAPFFQNTGNWYNKLHFVINTSGNPSDTTYLIAISSDNWVTTQYVQTDNTIGNSYTTSTFQTYAAWGGRSGGDIIGLQPSTTYKIKVKARQGVYSEGPFGPEVSATTSGPTLTFDIDVASSDQETASPYSVDVGSLTVGTVVTATDKIWIDIDTNAYNGGQVFIADQNNGLKSSTVNYTIASSTTDLSSATTGFGLIGNSVTQTSGGPLAFQSPYNGANNNVGIVDNSLRLILSSNSPIVGGRASIYVKAKASESAPAANDYSDLFTVVAAGNF